MTEHSEKRPYVKPSLTVEGTLSELTLEGLQGTHYDQSIPSGPIPQPGRDSVFTA